MNRSPRVTPAVVLGGSLLLSLISTVFVNAMVDERVRKRFDVAVDDTVDRIERRVEMVEGILLSTRALFASEGDVSRAQFSRYAASLRLGGERLAGVQGVGFAPV